MGAGEDGAGHLRYVGPALVQGGEAPGGRAGAGDEPGGQGRARSGRPHYPRSEQLLGSLQGPPGSQARRRPRKQPTCPRTSTAGAPRSRLKNAESTRSTRLTAVATTGRDARKAHPGGRRSPRSRSATRMPSATRGSRSGTCWKAGGSPMSCSWAFIRTCACSAGRSG